VSLAEDRLIGSAARTAELARLEETLSSVEDGVSSMSRGALHRRAAQLLVHGDGVSIEQAIEHLWNAWDAEHADPDTTALLVQCLEQIGDSAGICKVYALAARHGRDPEQRAAWLLKAVERLRAAQLDPSLIDELRQAVARNSLLPWIAQHRPTLARRLVQSFCQMGAEDLSVGLLDALLGERLDEHSFDDALRLGQLYAGQGRSQLAQDAYRRALSIRPGAAEALAPVREHLLEQGDYEQLAQLLAVTAAAAPVPSRQAQLWRELAQLGAQQLRDPYRAAEALCRAWEVDAARSDPHQIARLYAAAGRWDRVAHLFGQVVLHTTDPARKKTALVELATVQADRLGELDRALSTLSLALQLDPRDLALRGQRIGLLLQHNRPAESRAEMRAYVQRCSEREQRDAMVRRYISLLLESERPRSALRGALAQLDTEAGLNQQFLQQLWERSWSQGWEVELRAELLLLRWDWETRSATGDLRLEHGLRCIHECERLGDATVAQPLLARLLRAIPSNEQLRGEAMRLFGTAHAESGSLVQTTKADERLPDEPSADAASLIGRARSLLMLSAQSGAEEHAGELQRLLAHAVATCAIDRPDTALLAGMLRAAKDHLNLAQLLERCRAETDDDALRRAACRELAELYRTELERPHEAMAALEQLLPFDALDQVSWTTLEELYVELDQVQARARLLEQRVATLGGADRVRLLERLAQLYAGRLAQPDSELACYRRILQQDPSHERALLHCRRWHERRGETSAVTQLLAAALEAARESSRREGLLRELAVFASERLEDPERAALAWQRLAQLDPEDADVRARMRACLSAAGKWPELADALRVEIARSEDPSKKVELCVELAELSVTHLDDRRTAVLYLQQARRIDQHNTEVLVRLESVYEQLGRWRALVSALQHHVELERDAERKVHLLHRVIDILRSRLNRDEEALAVGRQAREILPSDETSTRLMSEIYTTRGQWQQLASLLRERIGLESDDTERSRLHGELGLLLRDKLDDPMAAAKQFERAMHYDATNDHVMAQLRRLYERLGRWDLLVRALRGWAGGSDKAPAERAAAICEVGRLLEEQLDDLEGARQAYREAIALVDDFRPALTALRALAIARGEWSEAVALAQRALGQVEQSSDKARLLVENAAILRDHLDQPAEAMKMLERAIEVDPDNLQAAQWLANDYFARQDWRGARDLLQRVVEGNSELADLHQYQYRLAVAFEKLGQTDKAFAQYVKSFNREPMFLPTLDRLVDLCYRRHQWENAARIGEALIAHYGEGKSSSELADLHVQIGLCELHVAQREVGIRRLRELMQRTGYGVFVSDEALSNTAEFWAATALEPDLLRAVELPAMTKAIRQMERALRLVPEHSRALQVLAALTMSRGDWDRSLRYLDRAIQAEAQRPQIQARLLLCAADITATKLLSIQRAESYCERALRCHPLSLSVRRRIEARRGKHGERLATDTLQTSVDVPEGATQVMLVAESTNPRSLDATSLDLRTRRSADTRRPPKGRRDES
jgi:tetratricopeptide (TPR) repeat protein